MRRVSAEAVDAELTEIGTANECWLVPRAQDGGNYAALLAARVASGSATVSVPAGDADSRTVTRGPHTVTTTGSHPGGEISIVLVDTVQQEVQDVAHGTVIAFDAGRQLTVQASSLERRITPAPIEGQGEISVRGNTQTSGGTISPAVRINEQPAELLYDLPDWDDETAAYAAQSLSVVSARPDIEAQGLNSSQQAIFEGLTGGVGSLHDDTEGDFLWTAYHMWQRLEGIRAPTAAIWSARVTTLVSYFQNVVGSAEWVEEQGTNFDHAYGWGLADHHDQFPAAASATALADMQAAYATTLASFAPGDSAVSALSSGGRRWARQLRFSARLQEVIPNATNLAWLLNVVDIVLQDPEWDAARNAYWRTNVPSGLDYAAGDRVMNTFHMGIMMDALFVAWRALFNQGEAARAESCRTRLIALATFYRDVALNSNGFLELLHGININTEAALIAEGEGSPAGVYTLPPVNGLVFAHKFTGDASYLTRAWVLYNAFQQSSALTPPAGANEIQQYVDSGVASATGFKFVANNKGMLQYTYALFENGGVPQQISTMPAWVPDWQSPGVIARIPGSSFVDAIAANGWTAEDLTAGGTGWPEGLTSFSGGCVAYLSGQPYLLMCGGGHATHSDNSIYAFGPLFGSGADSPQWTRVGAQTQLADLQTCVPRNLDGRPTSRHTVGDFDYGVGSDGVARIVMMWQNSPNCGPGYTEPGIDVFDVDALEWDAAKSPAVTHPVGHNIFPATHSASAYHPPTRLWYAKGKGARQDSFGSYDPVTRAPVVDIPFSGTGTPNDSQLINMGDRNYLLACKDGSQSPTRFDVTNGTGVVWGATGWPTDVDRSSLGHDTHQDRIYTTMMGQQSTNDDVSDGVPDVAWAPAGDADPTWTRETFVGDAPFRSNQGGVFGRFAYVPELKGFICVTQVNAEVVFYRTAE